jgi:RNA polymerase sigma factor (sigma-70 family)
VSRAHSPEAGGIGRHPDEASRTPPTELPEARIERVSHSVTTGCCARSSGNPGATIDWTLDSIPTAHSDADLVAAAQEGDRQALAQLLERHRRSVLAVCSRMLGRTEGAEDAYQEAALQALLGIDRVRDPSRFGPWLCGIALNVCRLWLRSGWRESLVDSDTLADRGGRPTSALEESEMQRRVRGAVSRLPAGQRRATVLFYQAGLTQQEVADALDIPVSAVKARLHKARSSLRRRLTSELEVRNVEAKSEIEMRVAEVRRYPAEGDAPPKHVVVLEEVGGGRSLPIWIGPFEATGIALRLEGAELPRPDTYAFVAQLLKGAGARVSEVRISRLADEVFFAETMLQSPGGTATIDARPSDGVNLALVVQAPVRANSDVIDAAATAAAPRMGTPRQQAKPEATSREIAAEAIARMQARR